LASRVTEARIRQASLHFGIEKQVKKRMLQIRLFVLFLLLVVVVVVVAEAFSRGVLSYYISQLFIGTLSHNMSFLF
jgi:hypothetical protein